MKLKSMKTDKINKCYQYSSHKIHESHKMQTVTQRLQQDLWAWWRIQPLAPSQPPSLACWTSHAGSARSTPSLPSPMECSSEQIFQTFLQQNEPVASLLLSHLPDSSPHCPAHGSGCVSHQTWTRYSAGSCWHTGNNRWVSKLCWMFLEDTSHG